MARDDSLAVAGSSALRRAAMSACTMHSTAPSDSISELTMRWLPSACTELDHSALAGNQPKRSSPLSTPTHAAAMPKCRSAWAATPDGNDRAMTGVNSSKLYKPN